ncbi:unnamed protein product [Litomosoides sigmodontis]|uniref:Uncharacterized protein n=1 Tax=Litomosoides sigmodontis TaxID=42156 RepID=A0A3P6SFX4_LITSI|nr:unnamed protein product [Litomosoides sigmodontis]
MGRLFLSIKSKFGSLREFLSDYENIVNSRSQVAQAYEQPGESGYRSESTYEETVSTTRYSDSGTPEHNLPVRSTPFGSNPSIAVHLPGDPTITTETTTITATKAIKKVARGSKFADDTSSAIFYIEVLPLREVDF